MNKPKRTSDRFNEFDEDEFDFEAMDEDEWSEDVDDEEKESVSVDLTVEQAEELEASTGCTQDEFEIRLVGSSLLATHQESGEQFAYDDATGVWRLN